MDLYLDLCSAVAVAVGAAVVVVEGCLSESVKVMVSLLLYSRDEREGQRSMSW